MEVLLKNLSRSFGQQRVINDLSYHIKPGESYAVLGGNGSGKSTLLKLIQGSLTPSSGEVIYKNSAKEIPREKAAFNISLSGPYLELIEELEAYEFLEFYQKFRPLKLSITAERALEICLLKDSANKQIKNFSSGMRQRLRLGLALLSESEMVLLDEPTSNLDPAGASWYRNLVMDHIGQRTLVIGSNFDEREMDFCTHRISVGNTGWV